MLQRNRNTTIGFAFLAVYFLATHSVVGQAHHDPTSATSGEVKIHKERKIFLFGHNKKLKKLKEQSIVTEREWPSSRNQTKVEARVTERQGQSVRKQRSTSSHLRSGKQARVFKRHSHSAKKENTSRSRHRASRKHSMARN